MKILKEEGLLLSTPLTAILIVIINKLYISNKKGAG